MKGSVRLRTTFVSIVAMLACAQDTTRARAQSTVGPGATAGQSPSKATMPLPPATDKRGQVSAAA